MVVSGNFVSFSSYFANALAQPQFSDSSQFSPLNTLSDQLGPHRWVSSVFITDFNANIEEKNS